MTVLLTKRAVLLAKIESSVGVDASPTQSSDAFLVENPLYSANVSVLQRNFVRNSISPIPHVTGRILGGVKFSTELRSNGITNAGVTPAKIGRLLQACGFVETANTTPTNSPVTPVGIPTNQPTWTESGASTATNTDRVVYTLKVTTGGASGTARFSITPDSAADSPQTNVTVTSGSPVTVGSLGLTVTPTFSGSLTLGDTYQVVLWPAGITYKPVSTSFKSITIYLYLDGTLHTLLGAVGTFQVTAQAGQYAKIDWTFTGQYEAVTDASLPSSPVFETTIPAEVQLGRLQINGGFAPTVQTFSFDVQNTVQPREDINSSQGYNGVRIVTRNPKGGIDPEADNVANQDFWGALSSSKQMPLSMRVGSAAGNVIFIDAPSVQYTGLTYKDRNGILTLDAGLEFSGPSGDDEIQFTFC